MIVKFLSSAKILRIIAKKLTFHIGRIMRDNGWQGLSSTLSSPLLLLLHQNGVGRLSIHNWISRHHF